MFKLIYLIVFLLFCDISKVNTLQCYTCVDCTTVDANTPVETCGATTTSTTTTDSTATSQSSSATTPSTSPSTSATTPSTTASTPSTSPSTSATTPSTTASTGTDSNSPPSSDTPDTNPIIPPPTDENEDFIENFKVIRARRDIMRAESRVDYVCITLTTKVNNTDHNSRGCFAKPGNEDVCTAILQAEPNVACTSCNTDKCNSASSLQTSLFLVLVVTVAKFALSK